MCRSLNELTKTVAFWKPYLRRRLATICRALEGSVDPDVLEDFGASFELVPQCIYEYGGIKAVVECYRPVPDEPEDHFRPGWHFDADRSLFGMVACMPTVVGNMTVEELEALLTGNGRLGALAAAVNYTAVLDVAHNMRDARMAAKFPKRALFSSTFATNPWKIKTTIGDLVCFFEGAPEGSDLPDGVCLARQERANVFRRTGYAMTNTLRPCGVLVTEFFKGPLSKIVFRYDDEHEINGPVRIEWADGSYFEGMVRDAHRYGPGVLTVAKHGGMVEIEQVWTPEADVNLFELPSKVPRYV